MFSIRGALWSYPDAVLPLIKRYQGLLIVIASIVFGIGVAFSSEYLAALQKASAFSETTYIEGFVGQSLSLNPLLQSSSAYDKEITNLVFSSLVKVDPSGKIFPDLSETWSISTDGKTYTFFLRRNVQWHDGQEFTAEDVKTTFELVKAGGQNFANGQILKDVEIVTPSRFEISFQLPQPNSSFIELLSLNILPSHIFKGYTYNKYINEIEGINPIGTGPYKYVSQRGNIYTFRANDKYFIGKPPITNLQVKGYSSDLEAKAAFLKGEFYTLVNIPPAELDFYRLYSTAAVKSYELSNNTRILYYNLTTNKPTLSKNVRQALAQAIDKFELVQQIPGAEIAHGPYSPLSWAYNKNVETLLPHDIDKSNALLDQDGWKFSETEGKRMKDGKPLILTLTYLENNTNELLANSLKEYGNLVGIDIVKNPVTRDTLVQETLPQRSFEMLIFEVQTSIDPDLYTLWHSSQTDYPGLNISGYASNRADGYLVQGRTNSNRDRRTTFYQQFQEQIVNDVPAIFLYHPPLYTVEFDIINRPDSVDLVLPGQRLTSLYQWTIEPRWRNWQTR